MNKLLLMIVLLSLNTVSTWAVMPEDFVYKDALSVKCKEGSPVQEDLMYCVSRYYLTADKSLNNIYKDKMKRLSLTKQKELKQSQRIWLKKKILNVTMLMRWKKKVERLQLTFYFAMQAKPINELSFKKL